MHFITVMCSGNPGLVVDLDLNSVGSVLPVIYRVASSTSMNQVNSIFLALIPRRYAVLAGAP